jgi:ABC-type uncharacterized transport system substrate-binding protein
MYPRISLEGLSGRATNLTAGLFGCERALAVDLIGLGPDVMVSNSNFVTTILQSEVRTIPLVFVSVTDPIGSGFVQDLARPGGNITGFANFQPTMGGKWLEKLHEVAPQVQNVGLVMHPEPPNFGYLKSAEAAGAAGNIAAEAVVKAPPDGYTLLQVGTPNAINATLYAGHCGAGAVL